MAAGNISMVVYPGDTSQRFAQGEGSEFMACVPVWLDLDLDQDFEAVHALNDVAVATFRYFVSSLEQY